jgi:hypothetical protein
MTTQYTVGYADEQRLRAAARQYGAGKAELAAIERLANFTAGLVDVDRLRPLAKLAGVWLPGVSGP